MICKSSGFLYLKLIKIKSIGISKLFLFTYNIIIGYQPQVVIAKFRLLRRVYLICANSRKAVGNFNGLTV